ncbi:hypothetical protein DN748_11880 [Sinomicrobium soli]|nr:hypothetical protein DN748_11880 [Sinomicrobium sp. N-1-3-6]
MSKGLRGYHITGNTPVIQNQKYTRGYKPEMIFVRPAPRKAVMAGSRKSEVVIQTGGKDLYPGTKELQ